MFLWVLLVRFFGNLLENCGLLILDEIIDYVVLEVLVGRFYGGKE